MWQREFEKRFGKEAAPHVEQGLHRASWVLPRIVAACYPYGSFPMTRGWAEKQRLGDLPAYAKAEGQRHPAVRQLRRGSPEPDRRRTKPPRLRPPETSRWFAETAADILAQVAEAEKRIGGSPEQGVRLDHHRPEDPGEPGAVSCAADSGRGQLSAVRADAETPAALDDAIACERNAVEAWRQLVAAAGDVYADDLMMGVRGAGLCGHWKDELAALDKGLVALEQQRRELQPAAAVKPAPRYDRLDRRRRPASADGDSPTGRHRSRRPSRWRSPPRFAIRPASSGSACATAASTSSEDYRTLPMLPTGEEDLYQAVIPAEHVLPAWDLMYLIEVMDNRGNGQIHPDLNQETPYVVVRIAGKQ